MFVPFCLNFTFSRLFLFSIKHFVKLKLFLIIFLLVFSFIYKENSNLFCSPDENFTPFEEEEASNEKGKNPWVEEWLDFEKNFDYNSASRDISDRMSFRKENVMGLENNSPEMWVNIRKIIFVISFFIMEFYNDSFFIVSDNFDSIISEELNEVPASSGWGFRHLILFWSITTCFELYFSDFLFYMFGF